MTDSRRKANPDWHKGATPAEKQEVSRWDKAMDKLRKELANLSRVRQRVTNSYLNKAKHRASKENPDGSV